MTGRSALTTSIAAGLCLTLAATFGPTATAVSVADRAKPPKTGYDAQVRALMKQMSTKEKVGQLFVIEVAGRDANVVTDAAMAVNQTLYGVDTHAQVVEKYQPGGIIYYTTRNNDDNIGTPDQVATLSNGLQAASLALPNAIPLQISVDQEGGA